MISFTVFGIPVSQGSKRAFVLPNSRRIVVTEGSSKTLKPWRSDVRYQAQQVMNGHERFLGPVSLRLSFAMPKPKSYPKRRQLFMTKRPDCDKLSRAILDALTGVVFHDDSQIVECVIRKEYGDRPGVHVQVWEPYAPAPYDWTRMARGHDQTK